MKKYPFMQIDAFTDQPLGGNPCAILFDSDDLSPETMLKIAKEMNLSETSFVQDSSIADFKVRFFTPAEEIPMAGHPTIATVFALMESGRIRVTRSYSEITLELQVGLIKVEIFTDDGQASRIVMRQKKPEFLRTYSPQEVMPVFGLEPVAILQGTTIQTVSTGTPQLMIPLISLEELRKAQINVPAYLSLRNAGDFFSPHLFVLEGVEKGDTFARHFGVPPDTMEDPFTGSATGGMAAYLWHYGLIDEPIFVAEQGHWMGRPGKAQVEVLGERQEIKTVKVCGSAVTVLTGEFRY